MVSQVHLVSQDLVEPKVNGVSLEHLQTVESRVKSDHQDKLVQEAAPDLREVLELQEKMVNLDKLVLLDHKDSLARGVRQDSLDLRDLLVRMVRMVRTEREDLVGLLVKPAQPEHPDSPDHKDLLDLMDRTERGVSQDRQEAPDLEDSQDLRERLERTAKPETEAETDLLEIRENEVPKDSPDLRVNKDSVDHKAKPALVAKQDEQDLAVRTVNLVDQDHRVSLV